MRRTRGVPFDDDGVPMITADWLLARVRDNGEGCLVWTGYSQGGHPKANFGGDNKPFNVRRVIWKALTGRDVRKDRIIKTSCGVHNCADPAHLVEKPHGARNKGRVQSLAERAKQAMAQRAKSTMDPAVLQEIRAGELTQVALAAKAGCSQAMVSRIQLGKNWRDFSNPFSQLGAR